MYISEENDCQDYTGTLILTILLLMYIAVIGLVCVVLTFLVTCAVFLLVFENVQQGRIQA